MTPEYCIRLARSCKNQTRALRSPVAWDLWVEESAAWLPARRRIIVIGSRRQRWACLTGAELLSKVKKLVPLLPPLTVVVGGGRGPLGVGAGVGSSGVWKHPPRRPPNSLPLPGRVSY